ncbi:MAG: nitroreductase family protein [bacterium]
MKNLDVIQRWRSIRRYRDEAVPDDVVHAVLDAGRRAPSWENVQPWHFIAVTDAVVKGKLQELARGQKHVGRAPVVIACCGDIGAWEKRRNREVLMELIEAGVMKATEEVVDNVLLKDPMFCVAENGPAIVLARTMEQLAIAYTFIALEAVNQGLGVCMVGAFGNDVTRGQEELYHEVRQLLKLPDDHYLLALLTMGYPAEEPSARPRKPMEKIASREVYGNLF